MLRGKTMRTLSALIACLTLLLVTLPAPAEDYPVVHVGSVSPWGYTYGADGYWHKNGLTYTRTLIPGTAGYWYCGRYYAGTEASYQYVQFTAPTVTVPTIPKNVYSEDFST